MAKLNDATVLDVTNKMSLGVLSTTSDKNYFEEPYNWRPQLAAIDIFAETVPWANNPTEADVNVTNNPIMIEKLIDYQLDEIPASNGQGFGLYETPGDTTSPRLVNLILPQKYGVGYGFTLKSNGVVVALTAGQYQFDYANGSFRFDPVSTPAIMGLTNLTITAFRYIGLTLDGAAAVGSGGYTSTFTNADLVGGVLIVSHNLVAKDNISNIVIKDNTNRHISPDDIIDISQDIAHVDFRMIEPITGTWTVMVTAVTDTAPIPPVTIPQNNINSNMVNSHSIN